MIAKVGLGLVGLGAIGVGGVALAKPGWLGMSDPMPKWHSLSEDSEFSGDSSTYSNGKFGKKYGKYLVGVSKVENKDWWEWAYRRWNRSDAKDKNGKFKSVKPGYENNNTSLHKVCEEAYKQDATALKGDDAANVSDSEFKKSEVWKYCSPGTLVTLINENHKSETIGADSTNKKVLVSVKDNSNDWFWEQRNKDFWENSGNWSGSTGTGENDSNKSSFKKEFGRKGATENDKSSRKTVKELCGEAYKASKSDSKELTDAQKFCKLETN